MAQVESSFSEFTKRNTAVVFIAAQKIDGLFKGREHVRRRSYPFPVLFDESRQVTRAYGVYQAFGIDTYNLARRSAFLVGGGGNILWIAVSPHQREAPSVHDLLAAIEASDKY
jgi:peroxiredoxin